MACKQTSQPEHAVFNLAGSDAKAVALADSVLAACGGLENWEKTRFIKWTCLGKRLNVWDKQTGNVRIESRASLVLMNLHTKQGRAWKGSMELTDPAELQRAMDYGYEAWINDSYWLLLPFKLKDGGVTLKYLGEGLTEAGRPADILSLTFKNVGVTPNNKYHVYVDKETRLLTQWSYFMDAPDEHPRFTTPWANYQQYGRILLSDDRGQKKHSGLAVFDELPADVFESPDLVDWEKLPQSLATHIANP
ncbi:hypothetical protein HUU05_03255 [candidate division KSB1 bacterium]|nr:hypothetical protein [candidate division KSB1 bacterium]